MASLAIGQLHSLYLQGLKAAMMTSIACPASPIDQLYYDYNCIAATREWQRSALVVRHQLRSSHLIVLSAFAFVNVFLMIVVVGAAVVAATAACVSPLTLDSSATNADAPLH